MTKEQALDICKKHLPVWLRYKKDSTTTDNSPTMWNELNTVHRFAFGQFESLGCNDCLSSMFRKVYAWYEREASQPEVIEPTKNVVMTFPHIERPIETIDLTKNTYAELLAMAKKLELPLTRNISKTDLIGLIQTYRK